jgi:hypothetical protein
MADAKTACSEKTPWVSAPHAKTTIIELGYPMKLTKHAKQRSQQRGIPRDAIPLIVSLGTVTGKGGGIMEYTLLESDCRARRSELQYELELLNRAKNKAVLID